MKTCEPEYEDYILIGFKYLVVIGLRIQVVYCVVIY